MTDHTSTHRVWRVGADIDTDALAPGAYMKFGIDEIARHCLQRVRPEFAAQVQPGDVLVAGPNFGIGSSREQAAAALVRLGVAAVIAPSFNGLYFRNAFNVGLLLLTCPQAESLADGERITFDATAGRVVRVDSVGPTDPVDSVDTVDSVGLVDRASGKRDASELHCETVPAFLMDMVWAGGLLNLLKQRQTS